MMRGFTLVEVLVALALMALLSLMGWRALDALERSSTRIDAHAQDTLALQRVMGQITRDIRQHASLDVLPPVPQTTGSLPASGQNAQRGAQIRQIPALTLPPGVHLDQQSLDLVRALAPGTWQQVHWYVKEGALYRATAQAAIHLPLPQPERADAVLHDVHALHVRAWLPGRGWTAPPLPTPSMQASGLEIVLVRAGAHGEETYRNVVLLP